MRYQAFPESWEVSYRHFIKGSASSKTHWENTIQEAQGGVYKQGKALEFLTFILALEKCLASSQHISYKYNSEGVTLPFRIPPLPHRTFTLNACGTGSVGCRRRNG